MMQLKLSDFVSLFDANEKKEDDKRCRILLDEIKRYHDHLLKELNKAYEIARKARAKGLDPSTDVEIPIARNMAERVEQLMKIEGLAKRIMELEEEGLSREEICFKVAEEIVEGKFGNFDRLTAIDKAIRTAVAILTEGVVAAPIEGIAKVKIDRNFDGTEFLKIYYAGPIRSAGGTAQVISVLVGDYIRRLVGLNRYIPTEEEILRYIEEIPLYKKVANLQYLPSDAEIRLIVSNCPVCIDGEPTEDVEVSGYRNLPRVETNRVRGGMCLVIAEGIALKAPKLKKMVDKLKIDGWEWLDKLINKEFDEEPSKAEEIEKYTSGLYGKSGEANNEDLSENFEDEESEEEELEIAEKLDKSEKDEELEAQIKPKDKYLSDIVAGRPVFSHPSRKGGFRLRYGRARNSGFATVGINPATMIIADGFIAIGTQLKVERPGKAGGVVPVSTIDGPTVRLKNGDVVKINTVQEALALKDQVEKILDMGEILINYGDFLENNHPLMPSSYVYEWWIQEVEGKIPKGDYRKIDEDTALKLCDEFSIPLHPDHTYLWHDISVEDYLYLRDFIAKTGKVEGRGKPSLVIDYDDRAKRILEDLLVEHKVRDGKIVLDRWKVLVRCLGLSYELKPVKIDIGEEKDVLSIVRRLSGLDVRAKALTRIGARMGRPEKSKERRMSPPPHILFPVGLAGGKQRDIKTAINYTESYNSAKGEITVEICLRRCKECGKETFWLKCDCGGLTEQLFYCPKCKIKIGSEICPRCGEVAKAYVKRKINVRELYERALKNLSEWDSLETIKGVIGLTSKIKMPERLEKGILRAKHGVFVFKDGTIRYDMTDLPITHFKPREINVTVEKLRELGYTVDWKGNELKSEDQIVELKPQDVILSKDCAEYLVKVAKFIDDLLVKFYGLEPFYNVEKPEDLIGHLVIGLAPHTSAGVLGRIIGFTDVLAGYAHPYFHAAKRRNCDGDEDCVMLLLDGLLNFSRYYLPDKRGGQMDAPLVLTAIIDPREVDSEVHNMDIVEMYPLDFYKATLRYADPKELVGVIERVEDRLSTELRFCCLSFTHDTESIALGVKESAYKSLESMQDKVKAQMSLAEKIVAVDEHDVAERVLKSHFLPDILGNLRAFSRQEFRCVNCNAKYRRLPLIGKCVKCGGKLTLTVHNSSITKYLDLSKYLCEKYSVSNYTKQRLMLIDLEIRSLFESDTRKQIKISDFFE
jgi:DNA polymerase II large subunit